MDSASELYPTPENWAPCLIVVFDVRDVGALARFRSERAAWREYADVEALDEHHYLPIVWAGLAREEAA